MEDAARRLRAWRSYLVPGTEILKNKVGARDAQSLAEAERKITALATPELRANPPPLTLEGHRDAHRRLFGEIYPWAGEFRTVAINKEKTRFADPERIASALEASYAQLKQEGYLMSLDRDRFVDRASLFFAQWNLVHPFRDGNGRTQRVMLEALGRAAGHVLNFRSTSRARMVDASIEASDPVKPSLAGLRSLISEAADPQRLATFDKMRPLLETLRRDGHFDWNEAHLSVARPGERLDGIAALPRGDVFLVRVAERLVIATLTPGQDMPAPGCRVLMQIDRAVQDTTANVNSPRRFEPAVQVSSWRQELER